MREIRIIILFFFQSSRQVHITGIFFTTWTCCTAKCTCTAYYNWMIKVFSVEFTVITCYKFLNAIHALPCSSCYVLIVIVLTLSQKNCASPHSKPRLSFGGSACRVYDWRKKNPTNSYTVRKVLADFTVCDWWRNCKALCYIKFRQIEGKGQKFSYIELSNSIISEIF